MPTVGTTVQYLARPDGCVKAAIITADHTEDCKNIMVIHDESLQTLERVTSVLLGNEPGCWRPIPSAEPDATEGETDAPAAESDPVSGE